jgi:O-antigen ligase
MSVNTFEAHDRAAAAGSQDRRSALRGSSLQRLTIDILAVMTVASLPWSTTAPAVFIALWLIALIPTVDWDEFGRLLARPACMLPLAFFMLAVVGMLWSDGNWSDGLRGVKPVAKLLVIPFLFYHFRRSQRADWVFVAFLVSCTLLMILSWIVLFVPAFKITVTASAGVPVKNYIDQSQEFALCEFALALPALIAFRERQMVAAIGYSALSLALLANMLFVASARTALIYIPVVLILFAVLHLNRRARLALFAGAAVAMSLVWSTSPYLRTRVANIALEYQDFQNNAVSSTAQRLDFWGKSIRFFGDAPLIGHGTGSIRHLFERDAVGHTGLSAEVVDNPHNQTLNVAVQWGLVGVVALYAIWLSHLLLFRGEGLAVWIGLVVVVQNVVSSLFNSHLFDFHEGWMYVLGVGIAGGTSLRAMIQQQKADLQKADSGEARCGVINAP